MPTPDAVLANLDVHYWTEKEKSDLIMSMSGKDLSLTLSGLSRAYKPLTWVMLSRYLELSTDEQLDESLIQKMAYWCQGFNYMPMIAEKLQAAGPYVLMSEVLSVRFEPSTPKSASNPLRMELLHQVIGLKWRDEAVYQKVVKCLKRKMYARPIDVLLPLLADNNDVLAVAMKEWGLADYINESIKTLENNPSYDDKTDKKVISTLLANFYDILVNLPDAKKIIQSQASSLSPVLDKFPLSQELQNMLLEASAEATPTKRF